MAVLLKGIYQIIERSCYTQDITVTFCNDRLITLVRVTGLLLIWKHISVLELDNTVGISVLVGDDRMKYGHVATGKYVKASVIETYRLCSKSNKHVNRFVGWQVQLGSQCDILYVYISQTDISPKVLVHLIIPRH